MGSAAAKPVRAILFDAFPIFDPRPISGLAERLLPGQGTALSDLYRYHQITPTSLSITGAPPPYE